MVGLRRSGTAGRRRALAVWAVVAAAWGLPSIAAGSGAPTAAAPGDLLGYATETGGDGGAGLRLVHDVGTASTFRYSGSDDFDASAGPRQAVTVEAFGRDGRDAWFRLLLRPGEPLTPGRYATGGALLPSDRAALPLPGSPGLGCGGDAGEVVVDEVRLGPGGAVAGLSAAFWQRCPASRGGTGVGAVRVGLPADPEVLVAPHVVRFPLREPGQAAATTPVTVRNTSDRPVTLGDVALEAASSPAVAVTADACSEAALAPRAECVVTVSFAPHDPGEHEARLVVPADTAAGRYVVPLSGRSPDGHTVVTLDAPTLLGERGRLVATGRTATLRGVLPPSGRGGSGATAARVELDAPQGRVTLEVRPPAGVPLAEGRWQVTAPDRPGEGAGLSVAASGGSCDLAPGEVVVHELEAAPSGELARFDISFTGTCSGGRQPLAGRVALHATAADGPHAEARRRAADALRARLGRQPRAAEVDAEAEALLAATPLTARYARLGGPAGPLGPPVGPEEELGDGRGRWQRYGGSALVWSPTTGTREVRGAILRHWEQLGRERSPLGYPVSDETPSPDGVGRVSVFEHGTIAWSPTTGAREVHGAIRNAWAAAGRETGPLGYPVSDEYDVPGGRASDFQRGRVTWDRASRLVTVSPR